MLFSYRISLQPLLYSLDYIEDTQMYALGNACSSLPRLTYFNIFKI